jgi:hypothetical protein
VPKFHTFWCLVAQESSFERSGLSFLQVLFFTGLIRCQYRTPVTFYRTCPVPLPDLSGLAFVAQLSITVLSIIC